MQILLKVSRIVLVTGIALLTVGILLTVGPKVPLPNIDSPEPHAIVSLFAGTLLMWIGCLGLAITIGLLRTALAGAGSIVVSFLLPWLLHAVGVVWWSRLLGLPSWSFFLAGCLFLAVAAFRLLIRGPYRICSAALSSLRMPKLLLYLRAGVVGLLLGAPVYLSLASWYAPHLFEKSYEMPNIYSHNFVADFDWDAAKGFSSFRIDDSEITGGIIWERLVALQIKPRLDSFLRLGQEPRIKGWALGRVLMVIPLAYENSWGSGGMGFEDLQETELMRAAKKGDLALVRKLLAEGADVNARNRSGRTPLIYACAYGRVGPEVVETLLAAGADANATDRDAGRTPLIYACEHGRVGPEVVEALLAAGADPNVAEKDGRTALNVAAALATTAVVRALLEGGARVNGEDAPLITAAGEGRLDMVRELLAAGADANRRSDRGETALSVAERKGHVKIAEVLKKARAKQ